MSVRTYYHNNLPGATALPHDSLPPAASDRLEILGWQLWMLTSDNIEKQAADIAKGLGYTRPTDKINVLASETIENAETVEEKVKMTAKLQASKDQYTATTSSVVLIVDGKGHYDIEDPIEKMWIRVILVPGVLMHIPKGAHTRVAFEGPDGYLDVLMWFDATVPHADIDWVKGEDTHNHSVRSDYLHKLGLQH
ncbi:hypothetical protein F5890DRAFT_1557199 [Lentinula detonsa]|uniref:Uncharacterized protein n=1 Tax=Lentinula detonsa TaxID=2804962 RepID=A0AA38UNW0_9AGAR|nr:hypothetical protein F5890DRAFT_1557199 [Lentinula detonsa]